MWQFTIVCEKMKNTFLENRARNKISIIIARKILK